jgi:hypothetical protein
MRHIGTILRTRSAVDISELGYLPVGPGIRGAREIRRRIDTLRQFSRIPAAKAGGVGCQTPGSDDAGKKVSVGVEPSFARAAIIAAAAALPMAMPLSLELPLAIRDKEFASPASSVAAAAGK